MNVSIIKTEEKVIYEAGAAAKFLPGAGAAKNMWIRNNTG
jgi:hypothetical protein